MVTCTVDPAISRVEIDGFRFPLGAYPVEPMKPKAGYSLHFEPADGGDQSGDWEEWPDRYHFDVVISSDRVEPLCRMLLSILPGRVYPILDVLGRDAYREIDPFIAYELIPLERFTDGLRRFRDFLLEDGMVGFGAMCEEPFFYLFVDEHKIVTIRAAPDMKEKVEKVLHAFDLELTEEPAGADAATHEHRSVLLVPDDRPELLGPDEVVEQLRDAWQLVLNVDPDENVDDDGQPLGVTAWRCLARCELDDKPPRYAEVILKSATLRSAEECTFDAVDALCGDKVEVQDVVVISSDRMKPEQLAELKLPTRKSNTPTSPNGQILSSRWLDP